MLFLFRFEVCDPMLIAWLFMYLQTTALHICLLLLDVALASHDVSRCAVSSTFWHCHLFLLSLI